MDLKKLDSKQARGILAGVLVLVGLYGVFGGPWGVERLSFQGPLSEKASEQIDAALEKNLVVFAMVSTIKAAAAVIEGSSVGVGFDLELGDLVQPAYDYIDFIWKLFLYAVLVLTFYKLMVECGILGLGLPILGAGLVLCGLGLTWSGQRPRLLLWAKRLIVLGGLVAYGVPVVLLGSHSISARFTMPLKEATAQRIRATESEFSRARGEFLAIKDQVSVMSPAESLEKVRVSLSRVVQTVTNAAWDSMKTLLYYIAILLFDLLLLPVLMALLIYLVLHFALGRLHRQA